MHCVTIQRTNVKEVFFILTVLILNEIVFGDSSLAKISCQSFKCFWVNHPKCQNSQTFSDQVITGMPRFDWILITLSSQVLFRFSSFKEFINRKFSRERFRDRPSGGVKFHATLNVHRFCLLSLPLRLCLSVRLTLSHLFIRLVFFFVSTCYDYQCLLSHHKWISYPFKLSSLIFSLL